MSSTSCLNKPVAALWAEDALLRLAEEGFVAESIVDGPGLRCVIFTQGCPHGCEGCHNPQTHSFSQGKIQSLSQVYQQIHSAPLCRGVTFSGGEPFCQAPALLPLAARLKQEGYELAAYTGYTLEQLLEQGGAQAQLLQYLDILIDGPFVLAQKNLNLRFRGSENQRVLDVPQSLQGQKAVWTTQNRWLGEK